MKKASFDLKHEILKPNKVLVCQAGDKEVNISLNCFALTNLYFQLNPTELLALTCVGEDDRKIIEEVHFFIQMTTTMVLSVLKWMN